MRKRRAKAPQELPELGPGGDPGTGRQRASWRQLGLLLAALIVVCTIVAAAHWPALSAKAYSFDDSQYMRENQLVLNPSWDSVGRFFGEVLKPSTVSGYYQPLTMISLMVDCALGGAPENPRQFHRTSLLLHVLNVALIVIFLYLLFGHVWAAAAVGLLFGVHPMTVEPIPWVGERKTLLAALFSLGCLILYLRYVRRPRKLLLAGSLMLFVLALLSKPTSTPLAAALLLLDYWPLRRLSWRAVLEKVPFLVVAVVAGIITIKSQQAAAGVIAPTEVGPKRLALILCHNIVFYLYTMVWPVNLSWHYPLPDPLDLSQPMMVAGVVGTGVLTATLLISWRWTRAPLVSWLFFFGIIFPTMGVIGFTYVIAAHKFAYLPTVGLLMLLTTVAIWIWDTPRGRQRRVWRIAATVVVIALAALEIRGTRQHLVPWQDTESLHRYMIEVCPDASSVHYNLANLLAHQGRIDEAIPEYIVVVQQKPPHWKAHSNLGYALFKKGRHEEALLCINEALHYKPSSATSHYVRGAILAKLGRLRESAAALQKTLDLEPRNERARREREKVLQALRAREGH